MSEIAEALGQRLKAERERRGLSAQKAADELHLDGWVIDGLENGEYGRIGPVVYAKGHLKRYAELLGLPLAEILAGFDGQPPAPLPQMQPASMRMRTSVPTASRWPWVPIGAAALVVLVVAGVLWWRPWHPRNAVVAPPAASSPGGAAATAAAVPAPPPAESAGTVAAAGARPAAAAVQGVADPAAGAGRARLRLSFLGDSWVDVHDAAGQRLFAGNGHVNNVRTMAGNAPFRVYLKSASSIRLEINNHVVAIAPQYVVGNVAHFEAGADGVLRPDPRYLPAGAADGVLRPDPRYLPAGAADGVLRPDPRYLPAGAADGVLRPDPRALPAGGAATPATTPPAAPPAARPRG